MVVKVYLIKGLMAVFDDDFGIRQEDYYWDITAKRYVRFKPKNGHAKKPWCRVHRYIMGLENNGGEIVDHINRNPLDNRRSNLRVVSVYENALNRETPRDLPRNVYIKRNRLYSQVEYGGRSYWGGGSDTIEEAEMLALMLEDFLKKRTASKIEAV